jgi:hypothetical protein
MPMSSVIPDTTRRGFMIAATAALPLSAALAETRMAVTDQVESDLQKYIGFGNKQSGGPGDNACGAWLASELEHLGFTVERQTISAPFFEPARCEFVCGNAKATVWPQPIVVPTGPEGKTGPLVRIDSAGRWEGDLKGAIALLDLAYGRWSTAVAKPVKGPIIAAFAAGAEAVVVITNGPTGKIIALNGDGRQPMFAGPVALLAPEDAQPFLAAAIRRDRATLTTTGNGGHRPAFNLIGRLDRGKPHWLAISTPRSGWDICAGERGGGVAAWLWLARWAAKNVQNYNLAFVCNSCHEYEYLGASQSLKAIAPKPEETFFWLHLGANVAALDWHEGLGKLMPLPNVDSQRYISVSPALLPLTRAVFAGHPGFEAPFSRDVLSAGELDEISAAGYKSVAGCFGVHRFHHVADDDSRCVSASVVATTAAAFQRFVEHVIAA